MSVTPIDLSLAEPGELFLNRELSWLEFNQRVLDEASDERVPLLERLKFLGICASNLDEFFMVRVAGLKGQLDAKVDTPSDDGLTPATAATELLRRAFQHGPAVRRDLMALRAILDEWIDEEPPPPQDAPPKRRGGIDIDF